MTSADPLSEPRPTNVRWIVFALGCGTSWMLYLHRYTFALIKPKLAKEWDLGKDDLGLLDGAFSVCYSLFQFPAGIFADVAGAHLFLGAIILLWSLALAAHAWVPDVDRLWYARATFGTAQAGAFASVSRITRTWFPMSIRTSVQGWMGVFSGRTGAVCANVLFATVLVGTLHFGWRTSVYIFACAGGVLGIAFLLLFRNSPRQHPLANAAEADLIAGRTADDAAQPARPRMSIRGMFSRMSLRSILNLLSLNLVSTMSTMADNIYSKWIPLFLADAHGLDFKEMGIYSALPLLGGALGGAFGGYVNDLAIRRSGNRRWSRSLVGCCGKGAAGVLILTALLAYDNPYLFCGMLFFVKFCADCSLATRWGTVTDIGGNATATVFAFNNSIAGIGAIAAPVMYGFVAENLGWEPVFIIAAVCYFACAGSWLLVNCTIPVLAENQPES